MPFEYKQPANRKGFHTLLFYLTAAILIYVLHQISPSGPCNPGAGILAFMLLPFVSFILLVMNFKKAYKGDKGCRKLAAIHFSMMIAFMIYMRVG